MNMSTASVATQILPLNNCYYSIEMFDWTWNEQRREL